MGVSSKLIDALLPQTQCGLCGYGGCMPYAEAISMKGEAINLCPPGGVVTLTELANLTGQNPTPFIEDMQRKQKPPLLAVIQENDCIGCTKCIKACPVDAIFGAAKLMHSIITSDCTGCELCVPVCPVDCIDMHKITVQQEEQTRRDHFRQLFSAKKERLENAKDKPTQSALPPSISRQDYIKAAIARVKAKRS